MPVVADHHDDHDEAPVVPYTASADEVAHWLRTFNNGSRADLVHKLANSEDMAGDELHKLSKDDLATICGARGASLYNVLHSARPVADTATVDEVAIWLRTFDVDLVQNIGHVDGRTLNSLSKEDLYRLGGTHGTALYNILHAISDDSTCELLQGSSSLGGERLAQSMTHSHVLGGGPPRARGAGAPALHL